MSVRFLSGINVDSNTLFVDSTNNRVGIGTASPSEKFSLYGGDAIFTQFTGAGNGSFLKILNSTTTTNGTTLQASYFGSGGFGDLKFEVGGSERLRITAAGNVGIGTTAPVASLQIGNGTSNSPSSVAILSADGGNAILNALSLVNSRVAADGNGTSINFHNANNYGPTGRIVSVQDGGTNASLRFSVYNSTDDALVEKVTLLSSGNVGIGTTSPSQKLHINGGNVAIDSSSDVSLIFAKSGASKYEWYLDNASNNFGLYDRGNTSWRFFVTNAGNVGIGTTSPSQKLHVVGVGRFDNIGAQLVLGTSGVAGAYEFSTTTGNALVISLSGVNERMRIDSSGNVGIGTTNIYENLTVSNSSGASIGVGTGGAAGTGASPLYTYFNFRGYGDYIKGQISSYDVSSNFVGGVLIFSVQNTSAVLTERMRISSAGALKLNAYGSGSNTGTATQRLAVDASGNVIEIPIGSGPVDGNGTANYVTKWSDADTITNSVIYENGGNIGIGVTNADYPLTVGSINVGAVGAQLGLILNSVINTAIPSSSVKAIIGATNSGFGYAAGSLLIQPRTGVNAVTVFATEGTEKMRITHDGNVGIGTTSPSSILDASLSGGATSGFRFKGWSDASTPYLLSLGTQTYPDVFQVKSVNGLVTMGVVGATGAAPDLVLQTNTTERMRITSAGNVGIGTTSPGGKLQVGTYGTIAAPTYSTANGDGLIVDFFNIGPPYTRFGRIISSAADASEARLSFFTKDSSANPTEKVTILGNGNVGIGTTSPVSPLDVNGIISSRGIYITQNSGTYNVIYNASNSVSMYLGGSADQANYYDNNTHYFRSSGGGTYYAIINSSGNFGIGTTSPSYKLDVRGNLLAVGPNGGPGIIGIWEAESIASTGGSIVSDSSASGGSVWTTNGNYQLFGPYTNLPRGNYRLSVRVKVADASYTGNAVRINAYIPSVGSAQDRYIKGIDFSANDTWEMFSIPFKITGITANNVEFYVFGLNSQSISVDYLSVTVDNDSYTAQNWGNLYVNGNVGIGTTAQLARTTILSDSSAQTIGLIGRSADNIATIRWWNNAGNTVYTAIESNANYTIYNTVTNGYAAFFTNNSERLRITSAGNVGIGTTNPIGNLEISTPSGDTIFRSVVAAGGTASSNDLAIKQDFISGVTANYLWSNSNYTLGVGRNGGTMPTTEAEATALSSFVVANTGNVGIGTTGPSYKLHTVVASAANADIFQAAMAGVSNGFSVQRVSSSFVYSMLDGGLGINNASPTQALHVTGNARVTGAFIDSNNEAGTAGQVLSSTASGTDWITPATTTASSLYDLLPAARVAYNWVGQVVNDTWTTIFSKSDNILTTGTWMVKMYVNDFAVGGGHYQYVYSGIMTWEQGTVNQTGEAAFSEIYLHRMGHAANASVLYLRTAESGAAASNLGYFQIKGNYSNTSNQTIQFQFVKIF
jgi:hypothetical protein